MKYMMMMFGSAEEMGQVADPQWIREMIAFMVAIDVELQETGEMVFNAGLVDPSQAVVVAAAADGITTTDGPFAEAKESIVGFWILDVADEARILEIAARIVPWSGRVELRRVADGPPDI
jgi:hypothetical protein